MGMDSMLRDSCVSERVLVTVLAIAAAMALAMAKLIVIVLVIHDYSHCDRAIVMAIIGDQVIMIMRVKECAQE